MVTEVSRIYAYNPINAVSKSLVQHNEPISLFDKIEDLVFSILSGYTMYSIRLESTSGILMAFTPFQVGVGFAVVTFVAKAAISGHSYSSIPCY